MSTPLGAAPLDTLGRPVHDLRISVTDRCNLRCTYCMPAEVYGERYHFLPRNELLAYHVGRGEIVARSLTDPRLDRMAVLLERNELLVTSPLHSAVLRFDAKTLEPLGRIDAQFGVRSLAIDPGRRWLVCGSLVDNSLWVIDLETGRRLARYHVGPWLREIVLDPESATAYVSSHSGLFRVRYAERVGQ